MNRRSFFKALGAILAAPYVPKITPPGVILEPLARDAAIEYAQAIGALTVAIDRLPVGGKNATLRMTTRGPVWCTGEVITADDWNQHVRESLTSEE